MPLQAVAGARPSLRLRKEKGMGLTGPMGMDLSKAFLLTDPRADFPGHGGKPVALQTKYRWALTGVGGVKLKTIRIGGRLCTTEAWIAEFVGALNADRPQALA